MNPVRKAAIAWALSVTALAVAVLAGSFIYLRGQHLRDETLVESRIGSVSLKRGFKLEEARKAGYTDVEIAKYFAKTDKAEFDERWELIFTATMGIYIVVILGILSSTLHRESKHAPRP